MREKGRLLKHVTHRAPVRRQPTVRIQPNLIAHLHQALRRRLQSRDDA